MVTSYSSVPEVMENCSNSSLKFLIGYATRQKAIKKDFVSGSVKEDGTVYAEFTAPIRKSGQLYRLQSKVTRDRESHHYSVI